MDLITLFRVGRRKKSAISTAAIVFSAIVFSLYVISAFAQQPSWPYTGGTTPQSTSPVTPANPLPVTPAPGAAGAATGYSSATVGTSSAAVIAAGTYHGASVFNQSTTATVYCNWGSAAVASATAGQQTFAPLSGYVWDYSDPPVNNSSLNCISSAASTPVTYRAF